MMGTPGVPERGFQLKVHSPCYRGWYRAKAHMEGTGPATTQHPEGIPFDFEDTGWAKYITAEQCAGGS